MDRYVVFSHGKDAGPWGVKITALAGNARALFRMMWHNRKSLPPFHGMPWFNALHFYRRTRRKYMPPGCFVPKWSYLLKTRRPVLQVRSIP